MANKMERFTNHSRRILSLSQEAAEELGHVWIEPEHLLIGMSRAEGTSAFSVLSDADILAEKLLPFLRHQMKPSKNVPEYSYLGLSYETIQVLELSVEIANQRELLYIDPTVMLLGLIGLKHEGIEAALQHFGHDSRMIAEMATLYLGDAAETPADSQEKQDFMTSVVQRFQEFFRKKKNDE